MKGRRRKKKVGTNAVRSCFVQDAAVVIAGDLAVVYNSTNASDVLEAGDYDLLRQAAEQINRICDSDDCDPSHYAAGPGHEEAGQLNGIACVSVASTFSSGPSQPEKLAIPIVNKSQWLAHLPTCPKCLSWIAFMYSVEPPQEVTRSIVSQFDAEMNKFGVRRTGQAGFTFAEMFTVPKKQ